MWDFLFWRDTKKEKYFEMDFEIEYETEFQQSCSSYFKILKKPYDEKTHKLESLITNYVKSSMFSISKEKTFKAVVRLIQKMSLHADLYKYILRILQSKAIPYANVWISLNGHFYGQTGTDRLDRLAIYTSDL